VLTSCLATPIDPAPFLDVEEESTHVVFPPVDPLEEEYARPTMRRDRSVLLHWYYFPDSHDTWTSVDLPVEAPDSPAPPPPQWRVSFASTITEPVFSHLVSVMAS
jgi:hypothetical protein